MRISWTPSSPWEATTAYMSPLMVNVETLAALASTSKPLLSSVAELTASRVPFSWMRIIWTPSSPRDATIAYMASSIENAETSYDSSRTSNPRLPLVAESTGMSTGCCSA